MEKGRNAGRFNQEIASCIHLPIYIKIKRAATAALSCTNQKNYFLAGNFSTLLAMGFTVRRYA